MKLNLGCGKKRLDGYVNMDVRGGEVMADAIALPFRDKVFDVVLASHVLEHIIRLENAMQEIHRVLKDGGELNAIVPFGMKALYIPSHFHAFNMETMMAFCQTSRYSSNCLQAVPLFELVSREVTSYRIRYRYHINKYLNFLKLVREDSGRLKSHIPLGTREEITFILRKI